MAFLSDENANISRDRHRISHSLLALLTVGMLAFPAFGSPAPIQEGSTAGSGRISAQEATRIVTMGTLGGPRARAGRSEPANVLQVGDRAYLIDAGPGVSHALARAGFQPVDIRKVFLTHLHFDHVGGLASMLGFSWTPAAKGQLDVYGPPGTGAFVKSALDYLSIPIAIYAAQSPPIPPLVETVKAHDMDVVRPTEIYRDDKVRVSAVENSHYVTIPATRRPTGAARSYSYRFDTPDRSVVFSGDTGPSRGLEELARGADVLVIEVMDMDAIIAWIKKGYSGNEHDLKATIDHMLLEHISPREVGRLAARAGVKFVILTHIAPGDDDETDLRRYTQGVREFFSGVVVVAHDGAEY